MKLRCCQATGPFEGDQQQDQYLAETGIRFSRYRILQIKNLCSSWNKVYFNRM